MTCFGLQGVSHLLLCRWFILQRPHMFFSPLRVNLLFSRDSEPSRWISTSLDHKTKSSAGDSCWMWRISSKNLMLHSCGEILQSPSRVFSVLYLSLQWRREQSQRPKKRHQLSTQGSTGMQHRYAAQLAPRTKDQTLRDVFFLSSKEQNDQTLFDFHF